MRHYVWYSPEFDIIALQCFREDCHIVFEWSPLDAVEMYYRFGLEVEIAQTTIWVPIGEL